MGPPHIDEIRENEFPVLKQYLPLNHAGVAPVCTRAAVMNAQTGSKLSRDGFAGYDKHGEHLQKVRELCAWFIGAQSEEIAFVRNTSHGLSLVAAGLDWQRGDNVVTTDAEFPANMYPWLNLKDRGVEVRTVSAKGRAPTLEEFAQLVDERTRVLAISSVEFATGCRFDLKALSDLVHSKGGYLCVDAIQSLGVIPMDVTREGIDFLSADGHKWICSFEGTGLFYCKRELLEKVRPSHLGWNSVADNWNFDHYDLSFPDEARRFEEGSLPISLIFAMGRAIELLVEIGAEEVQRRALGAAAVLRAGLNERGLKDLTVPGPGGPTPVVIVGGDFDVAPTGKALTEKGVQLALRGGGLRLSPHHYNNARDAERFWALFDEAARP